MESIKANSFGDSLGILFGTTQLEGTTAAKQNPMDGNATYYVPTSLKRIVVYGNTGRLEIDRSLFYNCTMLESITIEKAYKINNLAFSSCTGLKEVSILALDERNGSLGRYMFSSCNALESITVPFVGLTADGGEDFGIFFGSPSGEEGTYRVNDGTYEIPSSLKKITILGGEIKSKAFNGYTSLTAVGFGEGITKIGRQAFRGLNNMNTIYISGNSLSSVDYQAFLQTPISAIYVDTLENWLTTSAAYSLLRTSGADNIYVNNRLISGEVVIPGSVKQITGSFRHISGITSVVLEEGVKTIGAYAFEGCTDVTSVTFPSTLKTIDDYAFEGCVNIEDISLPVGIESIGSYAFSGLSKITEIEFGSNLKEIGNYAFSDCTGITGTVTMSSNLTNLGQYAFARCTGISKISLNQKLGSNIGYGAFLDCLALTTLEYYTKPSDDALGGCINLTNYVDLSST